MIPLRDVLPAAPLLDLAEATFGGVIDGVAILDGRDLAIEFGRMGGGPVAMAGGVLVA